MKKFLAQTTDYGRQLGIIGIEVIGDQEYLLTQPQQREQPVGNNVVTGQEMLYLFPEEARSLYQALAKEIEKLEK